MFGLLFMVFMKIYQLYCCSVLWLLVNIKATMILFSISLFDCGHGNMSCTKDRREPNKFFTFLCIHYTCRYSDYNRTFLSLGSFLFLSTSHLL